MERGSGAVRNGKRKRGGGGIGAERGGDAFERMSLIALYFELRWLSSGGGHLQAVAELFARYIHTYRGGGAVVSAVAAYVRRPCGYFEKDISSHIRFLFWCFVCRVHPYYAKPRRGGVYCSRECLI